MEIIAFKNMVWDLTRQISDGMDELFRPISAHYGLTHMQLRILLELWAEPESQTIGSLGRALGVTSGNMSSMCKRLEQEGFLIRFRDIKDVRVVKVALSEKGQDAALEIDRLAEERYASCLQRLGKERMEVIASDLKEINALLHEMLASHQKGNVE